MPAVSVKEECKPMKTKRWTMRFLSILFIASGIMLTGSDSNAVKKGSAAVNNISMKEFSNPDMKYRPGTRWWWPGAASSTEDLLAQVDYLADNGFGTVEINAFNHGFVSSNPSDTGGTVNFEELPKEDQDPAITQYDSPVFYKQLGAVINKARKRGLTVDLTAGSGYCANDDSVSVDSGMKSMALGRETISVGSDEAGKSRTVSVPKPLISPLYVTYYAGEFYARWFDNKKVLQALIISKIIDDSGESIDSKKYTFYNSTYIKDVQAVYKKQYILDPKKTVVIDAKDIKSGKAAFTPDSKGDYEVISLYSVPSGETGFNSIPNNPKKPSYVVDHLDPEAVAGFVNGWLGDKNLKALLPNVRAAFNDSYEFRVDIFYNNYLDKMAKDKNSVIGYDIRKYLPGYYKLGKEAFLIPPPMIKDFTKGIFFLFKAAEKPFINMNMNDDEVARLNYDVDQLINQAFLVGLKSFGNTLNKYGLSYRQQAYNPPIDTLKSSEYVDIPETEGLDEYSLKRVTSGAHIYGKNLITSEVFTLGTTPYRTAPADIKNGYNLMATSGVNNFFYHGVNAPYYGTEKQKKAGNYGEEGWRAFPRIGVEMGKVNPLHPFFKNMNMYAARLNYVMQTGDQYSDVALYMPLFGSMQLNTTVKTLNEEGYVWDAVNDDTIQNRLSVKQGRLLVAGSRVSFDALVVDKNTVPVKTMEALVKLAKDGANIVFFGEMPGRQPGYADGDYKKLDKTVSDYSAQITKNPLVKHVAGKITDAKYTDRFAGPDEDSVKGDDNLRKVLSGMVKSPLSVRTNSHARLNKRALPGGAMLAFVRNSSSKPNTIVFNISDNLSNRYYLDQATGKAYMAKAGADGKLFITLEGDGAVILLANPKNMALKNSELSQGWPSGMAMPKASEEKKLTGFSLKVKTDNFGNNHPDESKEYTFSEDVLGDWIKGIQKGKLVYVSDAAMYSTSFGMPDLNRFKKERCILDLGEVCYAAEVSVNGKLMGQVFNAPYVIDITDALVKGDNKLEVKVQPLGNNRRVGLRAIFDNDRNAKYKYYNFSVRYVFTGDNPLTLLPAGLVGPVTLKYVDFSK